MQGVLLDELQSVLEKAKRAGMNEEDAAAFGRDMCSAYGGLVRDGTAKRHGAALMLIGAGTRAPHDDVFLPTGYNMEQ